MSGVVTDARGARGGAAAHADAAETWAPFRIGIFGAVWLAALASDLGSWMHLVAASWLMTSLTARLTGSPSSIPGQRAPAMRYLLGHHSGAGPRDDHRVSGLRAARDRCPVRL